MTPTPGWSNASQQLIALGNTLDIADHEWPSLEELTTIRCSGREISWGIVKSLDLAVVRSAMTIFQGSLACRIHLDRAITLTLSPTFDQADLDTFLAATQDSPTLSLDLDLNKVALAGIWLEERPGCRIILFLFEESLRALLARDIERVERDFFLDGQRRKTILVLSSHDLFLDGPHLAIVGGIGLDAWATIQSTSPSESARASRAHTTRLKNLNWQKEWVESITPFHLTPEYLDQNSRPSRILPQDSRLIDILHTQFANLAIMFTAQRSEQGQGVPVSTYSIASRAISVSLRQPSATLSDVERSGVYDLLRVLDWAYEEEHPSSRFAFIQDIYVRELLAVDEDQRYGKLLQSSGNVIAQLEWRWEFFIKDRVDAYLAQVRDLENDVDKSVQSFADQLATLTKSLTDAMLGAVAAVITVLIASVIKEKFNPWLFSLGIAAYGVYVYVFHVRYGLSYQNDRFEAIQKDFGARKKRFSERIHADQVKDVVGDRITESETRWGTWYERTKEAYRWLLIVLGIFILIAVIVGIVRGVSGANIGVATPGTGTPTP